MKAQTYRPRVQNGQVAKRRSRPGGVAAQKVSVRGARRRQNRERRQGSNVLGVLMCIGALVATGFVFALRSQINTHQLGQAEAQLRSELDEIANRQRYEVLAQQRALSPREIDRAAKQAGLIQPKFNQTIQSQPAQPAVKEKKEIVNQRPSARLATRR